MVYMVVTTAEDTQNYWALARRLLEGPSGDDGQSRGYLPAGHGVDRRGPARGREAAASLLDPRCAEVHAVDGGPGGRHLEHRGSHAAGRQWRRAPVVRARRAGPRRRRGVFVSWKGAGAISEPIADETEADSPTTLEPCLRAGRLPRWAAEVMAKPGGMRVRPRTTAIRSAERLYCSQRG